MTSAADKFDRTLSEFADDLTSACPDSVELQVYALGLRGLLATAPARVRRGFYDEVTVPFGDRVLARDEAFFLERDYEAQDDGIVANIKSVYAGMNDDDRGTVYKYMRMLVLLSRKLFEGAAAQ